MTATRRVLLLGVAGLGAAAMTGCAGDDGGTPALMTSPYADPARAAAHGAALERLLVDAYDAALRRAEDGEVGAVPPAVTALLEACRDHHRDHRAAWSATPAPTQLGIARQTLRDIGRTSSVTELAKVLEPLEDLAAQTYTATVAQTQDGKVAGTAARILPVEAGHQAVLRFVTAQYPVPAQQIGTTRALPPGS
ncbi:ferritin-like domain-containing protein [Dactylosporangium sp. NPDC050588]|uniref:ferritin-like domain-containing protein n=1 Tax=Dactylosporangium sp. NPDC050588 TaxID=3157211 RepID=UPI00340F3D74